MLQVAWVTGAILCFLRALEEEEARTRGEEEPASRNRNSRIFCRCSALVLPPSPRLPVQASGGPPPCSVWPAA